MNKEKNYIKYSIWKKIIISLIFVLFVLNNNFAQIEPNAKKMEFILYPKVVLNHYSLAELDEIKNLDSLKLQALLYHYTSSFTIEKIDCEGCIEYNFEDFDVSEYETRRKEDEDFTFSNVKLGFKVTLISKTDLLFKF